MVYRGLTRAHEPYAWWLIQMLKIFLKNYTAKHNSSIQTNFTLHTSDMFSASIQVFVSLSSPTIEQFLMVNCMYKSIFLFLQPQGGGQNQNARPILFVCSSWQWKMATNKLLSFLKQHLKNRTMTLFSIQILKLNFC